MALNYKEFGQGEPLVILHGLFGTLDNWQTIAKQLAKDYWVFIVDQRNHGKSPHLNDLSYSLMAEDLKAFMDEVWIPKAHIMGHSMGGKTAMQFAMQYPDMVDQLIVVDMAPDENEAGHDLIFEALFSLNLDEISNRGEADNVLAQKIKDYGVRQFLLKNLTRNKEGGYRWKMNLSVIHQSYPNILKAVESDTPFDGETLFIRGGRSDYIVQRNEKTIREMFTDAELVTIEDAGHWVHADQPKELLNLVSEFLK